ncbi:hypothetical protein SNE35_29885 [Paucibacter sp. R3-3]|uniref:Uncharacterized protein n=1 Tax=Roseateles agri TaxID=3098619 RepID=A0ABU5DR00_9BURK|nr:hypothetical protein [Paucibacter sp. R3-3]MDY0748747.1 hypothetical protein [Paucibacter sp. R3-3]
MEEEEFDDYDRHDDGPRYLPIEQVKSMELFTSLRRLQFFNSDIFMRQQAFNLDMVDQFLMQLEQQVLRDLLKKGSTPREAHFLGAQSQMWIFAAFEVLRTWDQRIRDMKKLVDHSNLQKRIDDLRAAAHEYAHIGNTTLLDQLIELQANPRLLDTALRQQRSIHIAYFRLDFIRIAMAKHEVKGVNNSKAMYPGYGRINMYCGSLDYELENGKYSTGTINRRDIADSLRYLDLDAEPPTQEQLKEFEKFMTGKGFDLPKLHSPG